MVSSMIRTFFYETQCTIVHGKDELLLYINSELTDCYDYIYIDVTFIPSFNFITLLS